MLAVDEDSPMRSESLLTTYSGSSSLIRRSLVVHSLMKCTAWFIGFVLTAFAARSRQFLLDRTFLHLERNVRVPRRINDDVFLIPKSGLQSFEYSVNICLQIASSYRFHLRSFHSGVLRCICVHYK